MNSLGETSFATGELIDSFKIKLHPDTLFLGGSWVVQNRKPLAYDQPLLKFFYEQAIKFRFPVVLDIGAHTGSFCLLPAINPNIKCYAFEPNPYVDEILDRNIALNRLEKRVQTFRVALSDKKWVAKLKIPKDQKQSGLSCIGKPVRFSEWKEVAVPVNTLDAVAKDNNIKDVNLIKIDTEGCELFVLRGAKNFIHNNRPNILLEYCEENCLQFGYKPVEIRKLLTKWGYKGVRVSKEDLYFTWEGD